jgi:hypothetical protein
MQFTKYFYRWANSPTGAAPATVMLGADSSPTTIQGVVGTLPQAQTPTLASAANVDNVMSVPGVSKNGFPPQRVAVTVFGPTGLSGPLNASLYGFDSGSNHWFQLSPTLVAIQANQLAYFDAVAPLDPPQNAAAGLAFGSVGGVDYKLVVNGQTGVPTGTYEFAMGAVLTTP